MDDKTLKRHRANVRRMKQERRRTPEWYAKKRETLARAWSRFHPMEMMEDVTASCNPHPDAPHGFNRNASHDLGRYVCVCEDWDADV